MRRIKLVSPTGEKFDILYSQDDRLAFVQATNSKLGWTSPISVAVDLNDQSLILVDCYGKCEGLPDGWRVEILNTSFPQTTE